MQLNPSVFDLWVFRRRNGQVEYLLLYTSVSKAERFFNGGRFWQIPSGAFPQGDSVLGTFDRTLMAYGLQPRAVWAAELVYTIYNRRFDELQTISVFAAEVDADSDAPVLNPDEHAEYAWLPFEEALERVHYRGLKDGLQSTFEYVTGAVSPALELRLR